MLAACAVSSAEQNNLANSYIAQERFQEAITAYQLAQVHDPNNPIPYFNAARAYEALGQSDKALETLEQVLLRAKPDLHPLIYYNRGNVYFQRGDYLLAIADYKQSLLLDASNENARYNLELASLLAIMPTPTPIEMQVQPQIGQADPTMTPSPNPAGLNMPSPTPSPLPEAFDELPEELGLSGEDVQSIVSTPLPFVDGDMTAEVIQQILDETEARQQNIGGLPIPTPIIPTPLSRKDW